jgi:hypothetical protein
MRQRDIAEGELALPALRIAHDEGAAVIEVEEGAVDALASRVDGQAFSRLAPVPEPGRAHVGEAHAALPYLEPALHGLGQQAKHRLRRDRNTMGREVRRGTA